jgi:hypothetical protein
MARAKQPKERTSGMAVIAIAEELIEAPVARAFQRFIDYPAWDLWMPAVVRPIAGPARELRAGDCVTVSLGEGARRLRAELKVIANCAGERVFPGCWSESTRFFSRSERTRLPCARRSRSRGCSRSD